MWSRPQRKFSSHNSRSSPRPPEKEGEGKVCAFNQMRCTYVVVCVCVLTCVVRQFLWFRSTETLYLCCSHAHYTTLHTLRGQDGFTHMYISICSASCNICMYTTNINSTIHTYVHETNTQHIPTTNISTVLTYIRTHKHTSNGHFQAV